MAHYLILLAIQAIFSTLVCTQADALAAVNIYNQDVCTGTFLTTVAYDTIVAACVPINPIAFTFMITDVASGCTVVLYDDQDCSVNEDTTKTPGVCYYQARARAMKVFCDSAPPSAAASSTTSPDAPSPSVVTQTVSETTTQNEPGITIVTDIYVTITASEVDLSSSSASTSSTSLAYTTQASPTLSLSTSSTFTTSVSTLSILESPTTTSSPPTPTSTAPPSPTQSPAPSPDSSGKTRLASLAALAPVIGLILAIWKCYRHKAKKPVEIIPLHVINNIFHGTWHTAPTT